MPTTFDIFQFKKYHLGCGTLFLKEYLNINYWSHLPANTVWADPGGAAGTYLYNYDLVNGIPAPANSLKVIYHCHLLEHLTLEEGAAFLGQCFDCLEPGGIMRVVVPDLGLWLSNYCNNNEFVLNNTA
jgi:hypothetical protein